MTVSLRRNAAWNAANAIVVRGSSLLFWVLLARLISAEELGELLILQTTAFTAIRLVSTGFASASTQYVARSFGEGRDATAVAARISLAVGAIASVILAVLLYLISGFLAQRMWDRPEMQNSLHWAALFALFAGLAASFTGTMYGTHAFRSLSMVSMGANVAQLVLAPFFVWYAGYLGGIHALTAAQAIIAVGLAIVLSRSVFHDVPSPPCSTVSRAEMKADAIDLVKQTFIAALAHGMFEAASWLALAFLVRQPDGLSESALYGVGAQWRQLTLFVPAILMQVSLPAFATLTRDQGNEGIRGDLGRFSTAMKVYLLATTVVLAAIGPVLLNIYGGNFASGGRVFAVLQLTALLQGLQAYRVTELQGKGRFDLMLAVNVPASIILVFTAWLWAGDGALGLAFAFLAAYLSNEMSLFFIRRFSRA